MTDLRQGVTPTQHEVLDLIERDSAEWSGAWDWEYRIHVAALEARRAENHTTLLHIRKHAMMAAAMLIDAADEISRLIAVGATEAAPDRVTGDKA